MFAFSTALGIYLAVVLGLAAIATVASLGALTWLIVGDLPRSAARPHAPANPPRTPGRLSTPHSVTARAR